MAHQDATAGIRQDDARITRSIEPSKLIGKAVLYGPPSEPLPREEVLRGTREYISVDTGLLFGILSFDNSTRFTDYLNDPVDIIRRGQSLETTLNSPNWVSGWELSFQDAI